MIIDIELWICESGQRLPATAQPIISNFLFIPKSEPEIVGRLEFVLNVEQSE